MRPQARLSIARAAIREGSGVESANLPGGLGLETPMALVVLAEGDR